MSLHCWGKPLYITLYKHHLYISWEMCGEGGGATVSFINLNNRDAGLYFVYFSHVFLYIKNSQKYEYYFFIYINVDL